jgi:hypothetical protein
MKCPYCNKGMEQGFLQGRQRVAWVKNKHKFSLLPKQGEFLLENNAIKDFILSAQICKSCKIIVVDYADKEVREG